MKLNLRYPYIYEKYVVFEKALRATIYRLDLRNV